ncbi:MAG: hotdog fold thioesterase [Pasteurellaceae bacterium]|nr:hotdog fold thioesterase [Pasteurellaceae bacterium]
MIWKKTTTLAELNELCANCAVGHLGIEFTEQGENYLQATMPVDHRTTQPFGLLHGGVSAVLAETLASAAALLCCEETEIPVGTELNISHLKAVKQGRVTGTATPLHLGKTAQVWNVEICDENHRLCAVARVNLTLRLNA